MAEKLIVDNRRARHDYHLSDRVEAGVALTGTEVKSLRAGQANLQRAYAEVRDGEAWLVGAHIPEYGQGNIANHDPDRDRKLLLKRREIDSLEGKVRERGLTLVPTRLYFKNGRVKVEVAVARGKEAQDKRRAIAKRDAEREIERAVKSRGREGPAADVGRDAVSPTCLRTCSSSSSGCSAPEILVAESAGPERLLAWDRRAWHPRDDGRTFVKAVGSRPKPTRPTFHRQELHRDVRAAAGTRPVPRLIGGVDEGEGGWVALALRRPRRTHPASRGSTTRLDRVVRAADALVAALTPSPLETPDLSARRSSRSTWHPSTRRRGSTIGRGGTWRISSSSRKWQRSPARTPPPRHPARQPAADGSRSTSSTGRTRSPAAKRSTLLRSLRA